MGELAGRCVGRFLLEEKIEGERTEAGAALLEEVATRAGGSVVGLVILTRHDGSIYVEEFVGVE